MCSPDWPVNNHKGAGYTLLFLQSTRDVLSFLTRERLADVGVHILKPRDDDDDDNGNDDGDNNKLSCLLFRRRRWRWTSKSHANERE